MPIKYDDLFFGAAERNNGVTASIVEQLKAAHTSAYIVLCGGSRMGKTTITQNACSALQADYVIHDFRNSDLGIRSYELDEEAENETLFKLKVSCEIKTEPAQQHLVLLGNHCIFNKSYRQPSIARWCGDLNVSCISDVTTAGSVFGHYPSQSIAFSEIDFDVDSLTIHNILPDCVAIKETLWQHVGSHNAHRALYTDESGNEKRVSKVESIEDILEYYLGFNMQLPEVITLYNTLNTSTPSREAFDIAFVPFEQYFADSYSSHIAAINQQRS